MTYFVTTYGVDGYYTRDSFEDLNALDARLDYLDSEDILYEILVGEVMSRFEVKDAITQREIEADRQKDQAVKDKERSRYQAVFEQWQLIINAHMQLETSVIPDMSFFSYQVFLWHIDHIDLGDFREFMQQDGYDFYRLQVLFPISFDNRRAMPGQTITMTLRAFNSY